MLSFLERGAGNGIKGFWLVSRSNSGVSVRNGLSADMVVYDKDKVEVAATVAGVNISQKELR